VQQVFKTAINKERCLYGTIFEESIVFALFSELEVNSGFAFLSCPYSGSVIGYYMFQVPEVLDMVKKM